MPYLRKALGKIGNYLEGLSQYGDAARVGCSLSSGLFGTLYGVRALPDVDLTVPLNWWIGVNSGPAPRLLPPAA